MLPVYSFMFTDLHSHMPSPMRFDNIFRELLCYYSLDIEIFFVCENDSNTLKLLF